jgi:hypothetical protein
MLFVTFTAQLIAWAASLSELLHWLMVVTRAMESVVNVPLGAEQGPSCTGGSPWWWSTSSCR